MKIEEYEKLRNIISSISIKNLKNKEDRTLLYGYTLERKTVHLYLKDGRFHFLIYNGSDDKILDFKYTFLQKEFDCVYYFIPDKRAYPECCDYEFCKLVGHLGIEIPFTGFDEIKEEKQFYGHIYPDIKEFMFYPSYDK